MMSEVVIEIPLHNNRTVAMRLITVALLLTACIEPFWLLFYCSANWRRVWVCANVRAKVDTSVVDIDY